MRLSSDQHIIDRKFQQALGNLKVKPSARMWFRISNAWDAQGQGNKTKTWIAVVTILLLAVSSIGLLAWLIQPDRQSNTLKIRQTTFPAVSVVEPMQSSPLQTGIASMAIQSVGGSSDLPVSSDIPETFISEHSLKAADHPALQQTNPIINTTGSFPRRMPSKAIASYLSHSSVEVREAGYRNNLPDADCKETLAGRMYFGIAAGFNNTWLLDKEAIKSKELKYEPTFGGNYGIRMGYHFTDHWGIQAGWVVSSWEGQKYKNINIYERTTSLDYTQKDIALHYMHVPVVMQYQIPRCSELLQIPVNFNICLGAQYGRLISYRLDGNKGELNGSQLFNENELALVAGTDWDFITSQNLYYTLGIRTSFGTSIFNEQVPNYFEMTDPHNFLIGIHGAVNFSGER